MDGQVYSGKWNTICLISCSASRPSDSTFTASNVFQFRDFLMKGFGGVRKFFRSHIRLMETMKRQFSFEVLTEGDNIACFAENTCLTEFPEIWVLELYGYLIRFWGPLHDRLYRLAFNYYFFKHVLIGIVWRKKTFRHAFRAWWRNQPFHAKNRLEHDKARRSNCGSAYYTWTHKTNVKTVNSRLQWDESLQRIVYSYSIMKKLVSSVVDQIVLSQEWGSNTIGETLR